MYCVCASVCLGHTHSHSHIHSSTPQGYTNAPDLRIAWLETLSDFHRRNDNWVCCVCVCVFCDCVVRRPPHTQVSHFFIAHTLTCTHTLSLFLTHECSPIHFLTHSRVHSPTHLLDPSVSHLLLTTHSLTLVQAETAQCVLHIASLVAEYLNLLEPVPGMPAGVYCLSLSVCLPACLLGCLSVCLSRTHTFTLHLRTSRLFAPLSGCSQAHTSVQHTSRHAHMYTHTTHAFRLFCVPARVSQRCRGGHSVRGFSG